MLFTSFLSKQGFHRMQLLFTVLSASQISPKQYPQHCLVISEAQNLVFFLLLLYIVIHSLYFKAAF